MGTGSGISCWIGVFYGDSLANMLSHVLSFDVAATESFDQFPLPAISITNTGEGPAGFEHVGCRGSLGALVVWRPFDEFSITSPALSCELSIQLFVRRGTWWHVGCRGSLGALVFWRPFDEFSITSPALSSKLSIQIFVRRGTWWDSYILSLLLLFLEAKPSGGRSQLMGPRIMSGISYGKSSGRRRSGADGEGGKRRNHIPGNVAERATALYKLRPDIYNGKTALE
ncbi:hypothetical protein OROHE_023537 [Orobanche hederae]